MESPSSRAAAETSAVGTVWSTSQISPAVRATSNASQGTSQSGDCA
jgi:hypothetical protein